MKEIRGNEDIKDFRSFLARSGREDCMRPLKYIEIGEMHLSVQANRGNYCEPMETLESFYDYKSFEIIVFKNKKLMEEKEVLKLMGSKIAKTLKNHIHEEGTGIFAIVPTEIVQAIYERLQNPEEDPIIVERNGRIITITDDSIKVDNTELIANQILDAIKKANDRELYLYAPIESFYVYWDEGEFGTASKKWNLNKRGLPLLNKTLEEIKKKAKGHEDILSISFDIISEMDEDDIFVGIELSLSQETGEIEVDEVRITKEGLMF